MVQQISTNTFGVAKWVVSPDATQGTHTTLTAAIASASSGDTILVRDGTYTEDWTGKAGVTVVALNGEDSPAVTLVGTITYSDAGQFTITGCRLQTNSSFFLVVSGSSASDVNIENCYLNCLNNTGISFTSSSSSALIHISNSNGDIGTTGISLFSQSSTGVLSISNLSISNSGNSTTPSMISAGLFGSTYSSLSFPLATSGTGGFASLYTAFSNSSTNATCLTIDGSGGAVSRYDAFLSGSASAISVSTTITIIHSDIDSSNTNSITGAGTITYGTVDFSGSSRVINTTTQNNCNSSSFTPVVAFGGASVGITYGTQLGRYLRVGNMVNFTIMITLTSKGSSTGTMTITGLPFVAATNGLTYEFPMYYKPDIVLATVTGFYADLAETTSSLTLLFETAATGTYGVLDDSVASNTTAIRISGSYFV